MPRHRCLKRRAALILGWLVGANVLAWVAALIVFHQYTLLLGTAALAYLFGLRHAIDADHISAIDNVTRKLMHDGQRPLLVGLFFSLGHSTIVILLSAFIALSATPLQSRFPELKNLGGLIGTIISAAFLFLIAAINLMVFRQIFINFYRVRHGAPVSEQDVGDDINQFGLLTRVFRPALRLVDRSWKMYAIGFLFGLGFDTATEIALLGIAAAAATQNLPVWAILIFPLLFTAGMCLVDTADGLLMLGAYGWAFIHPIRKLYYNLAITAISACVAILVGGIEVLGLLSEHLNLHGAIWTALADLDNHFGAIGIGVIALCVAAWGTSALIYKLMGYRPLELNHDAQRVSR